MIMEALAFREFNEEFFTKRADRVAEIYRHIDTIRYSDFDIQITGPEYGWLDIHMYLDGEEAFLFEPSDVYPPFPDLKAWLDDMLNFHTVPSKSFIVDCESYHTIFSYDYIGSIETENTYEPSAFIQIGDDYSENEEKKMIQFIVPIRFFVACFYRKLKDYMYENRRIFSKNWDHPGGGDFDIRKLMRSFVSKSIEKELDRMERYSGDLGHWPLIQIK